LNQGEVDPPIISKVIVTNMLSNVIEFINAYVKIKQWDVIKMCNLYWLQIFTLLQTTTNKRRLSILTTRLMLFWQKEIKVFRSICVQDHLTQLGVELEQWTTHQKKIIVGNANEMKILIYSRWDLLSMCCLGNGFH